MTSVKIGDRAALEAAYPRDAFAADSARNAPAGEREYGVRILSAPDDAGAFSLERGMREIGEAGEAVFLAPQRPFGGAANPAAATADLDDAYRAFLDEIVAAARRRGYRPKASPGPGDPRIRGLRQ
jgi:hypothetical protein